jgi:hypothetical protein
VLTGLPDVELNRRQPAPFGVQGVAPPGESLPGREQLLLATSHSSRYRTSRTLIVLSFDLPSRTSGHWADRPEGENQSPRTNSSESAPGDQ